MDAPFLLQAEQNGGQKMEQDWDMWYVVCVDEYVIRKLFNANKIKIWEMYRKLLGETGENGKNTIYSDDIMSDKIDVRKIVSMRNILTENRQWCKVITGKKTGFTQKIYDLCVIFSTESFAYKIIL